MDWLAVTKNMPLAWGALRIARPSLIIISIQVLVQWIEELSKETTWGHAFVMLMRCARTAISGGLCYATQSIEVMPREAFSNQNGWFFHGGWFKKQNCNFSMNGPHIWTEKHKKTPPQKKKKKKRKKTSSIFLSEISNMLTQNKAQF